MDFPVVPEFRNFKTTEDREVCEISEIVFGIFPIHSIPYPVFSKFLFEWKTFQPFLDSPKIRHPSTSHVIATIGVFKISSKYLPVEVTHIIDR